MLEVAIGLEYQRRLAMIEPHHSPPVSELGMRRQDAIDLLARSKKELKDRFGVVRLALFGSTARDAATGNSDVDTLVTFDGPATSKRYFGALFFLEDLLGCPVDLVTEKALRPELRPYIEQERIYV